jgi:ABC-type Fe3+/spermidine/putrescine transport system ATPase subunit
MSFLQIQSLHKRYGQICVLDDCSLDIDEGEIVSLLGPSGSGKTTLLNMLAGFVRPDAGRIRLGGADINDTPPNRRGIGMVFQNYALFPHLTVARNVAYGLEIRRLPSSEIGRRVAEVLELLGLQQFPDRFPHQLSGGQQQRVALARVLVLAPKLLLLDEPFSALDAKLRVTVQVELVRLIRRLSLTAVFVTHDQAEALSISNRVAVMRDGRIEQVDTPTRLYDFPETRYVADFIGLSNLIAADVVDGIGLANGQRWPISATTDSVVLIRPENLVLTRADDGECTIGFALHIGPLSEYEVIRGGVSPLRVVVMRPNGADTIGVGARVRVGIRDVQACRVLRR